MWNLARHSQPGHVSLPLGTKNSHEIPTPAKVILRPWESKRKKSHYIILSALSLQSCSTLCDPMECSPPVSSVQEILQTRITKWVAISSSRESSWPRDGTHVSSLLLPALTSGFFTTSTTWEAHPKEGTNYYFIISIIALELASGTNDLQNHTGPHA